MSEGASYWGGIPQKDLNDDNRKHINLLCHAFGKGPWNISTNWDTIQFGGRCTKFAVNCGTFATYDFSVLTRLVIAAHDEAVRVEITPCNFRLLNVMMWTRCREGDFAARHPTIEQAVETFRGKGATYD